MGVGPGMICFRRMQEADMAGTRLATPHRGYCCNGLFTAILSTCVSNWVELGSCHAALAFVHICILAEGYVTTLRDQVNGKSFGMCQKQSIL